MWNLAIQTGNHLAISLLSSQIQEHRPASSSIVQTRNDTRKAPAIPTASLNSSLVGEEASNSNIDGDYTGPADDEKLGGNVHSKKSWFSDMEESFMVNSEIDF
jgi:hypothetical protein